MKRILIIVLMIAVLVPFLSQGAQKKISRSDGNLRILTLEGSPYNRGLVHGRTLKKEISELIPLWRTYIEQAFKVQADTFISTFLKKTNFTESIEKWTPELLDEVKGISDGAGVDFNTIFMYQLVDEMWANGEDVVAKHCTSIGVSKRGKNPTFVAQNLDVPEFYHGYQTLLHIKHDESTLESFVLTAPGLIAMNGMNNKSIAITCNTLIQLQYSQDGLPVAFIHRGVLKQHTLKDAVQFIQDIKHASGQNYIIGDPDSVFSFECSVNKVRQFIPYPGADRTYHTNHPLANDDFSTSYLDYLKKVNKTILEGAYFCYRFESLDRRLRDSTKTIDFDLIKSTLSSRDSEKDPISRQHTYACLIMILSEEPKLYIAPGKPHLTSFRTFAFTDKRKTIKH